MRDYTCVTLWCKGCREKKWPQCGWLNSFPLVPGQVERRTKFCVYMAKTSIWILRQRDILGLFAQLEQKMLSIGTGIID